MPIMFKMNQLIQNIIKNNIDFKISSEFKFEDFHRTNVPFRIITIFLN